MLTSTIYGLAVGSGVLCLGSLALAGREQLNNEYPGHPYWLYATVPLSAIHAFFYLWYVARIGS